MSTNQPVKLRMLVILTLLLLSHGVANIHCSTVPENSTDMLALLDFKQAITNDPGGVLPSNWSTSTPHCQWEGVACSLRHPGRVTTLDLAGKGLSGSIAASVGNLTFLRTLDLSNNHFSGQIPHLNNLQKMQLLNLSYNSLDGIIPDTLTNCSDLRKLDLSRNFLGGQIPLDVGLLSNLSDLVLYQNRLTGIIPPTLKNNTQLEALDLGGNQIEGSIPDELGQLSNLSGLYLGGNNLLGEFPTSLLNLSSLFILDLHTNKLGKTLPSNIGDALRNLQTLYLGDNMFEGQIPPSLGNASSLASIYLNLNNFTGQIPSSFGKLANLSILNLEDNRLEARNSQSWDFLYALSNCSSLNKLSLKKNQLQGVIPYSVGNLSTSLQYLLLGRNNLSGVVPPSIANLRNLIRLELNNNRLSGTIEGWIGNLKNLQGLVLYGNNFVGPIPSSIGSLTGLAGIGLENNNFEGPMPASLGNLKQLNELYLSSNKLTGEIPDALGQCQGLVYVEMAQNFLIGNIPVSFSNLLSLNVLNLSHNNLSGAIPITLCELQDLSKLDISYNHLQGEIPRKGVFENATDVSLDGNWGLCGGATDLHMPSCPAVSQKIKRKCNLTRLLIPIFGFMSLIMSIYVITLLGKKTSRTTYLSLLSFGKQFPRVSYKDLAQATGNFSESNLIGRGSYGSVYRGKLTQAKIQVAIKVFDLEVRCADKSFISECEVLRNIRHRNLLPILTACSTIDNSGIAFKALIYEFMPNGNLDTWLHESHGPHGGVASKCLGLARRISISVDIADALAYLHHDCGRPIVHCDLKPNNILLDDDMNAHLGDFGIASLVIDNRSTSIGHSGPNSSISVKGTIGYIAPEYAQSVRASTCGDVYSFGTVLLEMLIGKRPTDSMFENELNIVNFVERNYPDQMLHVIDPHLQEECKGYIRATMEMENEVYQCLLSLVQVALSCTRLFPKERLNMREVAMKLHAIRTSYVGAIKRQQVMLR